MDRDTLDGMKYRQLQKKAKEVGIKANLPKAQLIEEILKAAEQQGEQLPEQALEKVEEGGENKDDSLLSSLSSGSGHNTSGQEDRYAQFFDGDDEVVVTPRGSHKPRQYLPASGKRFNVSRSSSILTIPSSPANRHHLQAHY